MVRCLAARRREALFGCIRRPEEKQPGALQESVLGEVVRSPSGALPKSISGEVVRRLPGALPKSILGKVPRSPLRRTSPGGYLTLALTLILSVSLPLIMMMFQGAGSNAARMDTAYAFDSSMDAILSEYNRELLKQYDVFFVDMGYGEDRTGPAALEARIKYYMDGNFSSKGNGIPSLSRCFYRMNTDGVKVNGYSVLTDEKGLVFRRQAEDFIADLDGIDLLPIGSFGSNSEELTRGRYLTDEISRRRDENQREIDSIELPTETDENGNEHTVELKNPADSVSGIRGQGGGGSGFLPYVTDLSGVSHERLDVPGGPVSGRILQKGDGLNPELARGSEGVLRKAEFFQYLAMKASDYTKHEDKNAMKYQLEYILEGEEKDDVNLRKVVTKLVFVREMANVVYIFADEGKKSFCRAVAMALAAVALCPELTEPVTTSLLFAWAFIESLNDVKILLAGEKLPIRKTAASWRTGFWQILNPRGLPGGSGNASGGLTYREYLMSMIFLQDLGVTTMRFLDMVECDIRKAPEGSSFFLDRCIDSFDTTVLTRSSAGSTFQETRRYGYP